MLRRHYILAWLSSWTMLLEWLGSEAIRRSYQSRRVVFMARWAMSRADRPPLSYRLDPRWLALT
jgi:hypothetical protein